MDAVTVRSLTHGVCFSKVIDMKELLYNAKIVNEGKEYLGYVGISSEGKIEKVGEGVPAAELIREYGNTIDLNGNLLLPGVIDSHVHFREPGGEHKATIHSESRAAVAGGVTSFMEMPNTSPSTTTIEALEDKYARAAGESMANYSFYIGATNSNLEELKKVDYTRVPGVKLFMGSSTGGMLVDGRDALTEIFKLPVLIAVHCEDEGIIRNNTEALKQAFAADEPAIEWHKEIRSVLACYKSSAFAIELAKRYGTRLHIMHLSTYQEVALLSSTPDNITGEVCIGHLVFDASDYGRLGTLIKCNPAIKGAEHRQSLVSAVRDRVVSTISTDHAPHTFAEKSQGLFKSPSGMPSVQFSLVAMIDVVNRYNDKCVSAGGAKMGLTDVADMMCHNQAEIFGVEKRGFIREGYYADLVEVSLNEETIVTPKVILSKCGWSPFERMKSKVKCTWVNGEIVYTDTAGIIEENRKAEALRFRQR